MLRPKNRFHHDTFQLYRAAREKQYDFGGFCKKNGRGVSTQDGLLSCAAEHSRLSPLPKRRDRLAQ
jgi:hypothetical protein